MEQDLDEQLEIMCQSLNELEIMCQSLNKPAADLFWGTEYGVQIANDLGYVETIEETRDKRELKPLTEDEKKEIREMLKVGGCTQEEKDLVEKIMQNQSTND